MTTTWDLNRLRFTVRSITGLLDNTQISDTDPTVPVDVNHPPGIDSYINDFYLYDMPEHMRTLKLKQFFQFTTLPNIGTYRVPQTVYSLGAPVYTDNYQFAWYQDPDIFYRIWPEFNFIQNAIVTGNGTKGPYTFTLSQTPIQPGTVVIGITPNTSPATQFETFNDSDTPVDLTFPASITGVQVNLTPSTATFTNPGVLTGNLGGAGTIDYLTGAVSITFLNPLTAGQKVNVHYHPYVASRPRDILFFQQSLYLRPIPNDVYLMKMVGYIQPTTAMGQFQFAGQASGAGTDGVLFNEWWQMVAYGAALKIFIQQGDHEEHARYQVHFEQQKLLAQRKALKQLAGQRIQTPYGENAGMAGPQFPVFPIY
jgi:hypothetical protein